MENTELLEEIESIEKQLESKNIPNFLQSSLKLRLLENKEKIKSNCENKKNGYKNLTKKELITLLKEKDFSLFKLQEKINSLVKNKEKE